MNEYRLPQHETKCLQKAEISLCRIYKRAGVEDHPSLPRCLPTKATSSPSSSRATQQAARRQQDQTSTSSRTSPSSSADIGTALALSHTNSYTITPLLPSIIDDHHQTMKQQNCPTIFSNNVDDLQKLVHNYSSSSSSSQQALSHQYNIPTTANMPPNILSHFTALPPPQPEPELNAVVPDAAYSDRLWEWNTITEANKDYSSDLFK